MIVAGCLTVAVNSEINATVCVLRAEGEGVMPLAGRMIGARNGDG